MSDKSSSHPFSLRLPASIVADISERAKSLGKGTAEVIRGGIETVFSDDFRMLVFAATHEDVRKTFHLLRHAKSRQLPLPTYAAAVRLIRAAYLYEHVYDNANPRYVAASLSIVCDLANYCKKIGVPDGYDYTCRCLGVHADESLTECVNRLQAEIQHDLNVGQAEMLTRPLEILGDEIKHLALSDVANAVAPHLKLLLPVIVRAAKTKADIEIAPNDTGTEALVPVTANFTINGLRWDLYSKDMSVAVREGHHVYNFESCDVLGLCAAVECNAFTSLLAPDADACRFSRGQLTLSRRGEQVVLRSDNYQLALSIDEASELFSRLTSIFSSADWRAPITRHRELHGDI